MSKTILLDAPCVGEIEKQYLNRAVDTGYVSTIGPFVSEFEETFSSYVKVPHAVSTQSGTAALHMALLALGIGPGDEVIVPVLTFVASVNPIVHVGATPVFVDVDPNTWAISLEEVIKNITKNTKAIIPVHLYGNPCDMDTLQKIAEDNQIYIVEDATESLGSKYNGKYTGAFGDMGCFSFNGNKLMTTGGGGMVVSSDQKKNEYLRSLVNQGREQGKQEEITHIGFNNKMTNIEAALGLAQMQQLNAFIGKKKSFNRIYRERLDGLSGIQFQGVFPNADPCYWLTAIMCDESIQVSEVQKILAEKKIQTRRVFMPITSFVPYACFHREPYHNAQYIYEHGICLPSSMVNNDDDIQYVCNVLEEIISHEDNDLCKKE